MPSHHHNPANTLTVSTTQNILIFAYYSYKDPIFQSAVLPYFQNFPGANKSRFFVLLTFEQDRYKLTAEEIEKISEDLLKQGIVWKRFTWRSGSFKLIKKGFQFVTSIFTCLKLIREFKISIIYSEGWPGCILGYYLALMTGCRHVLHSFEPHADYMVEVGVWKKYSWETLFIRWHEKRVARHASLIFTPTLAYIEELKKNLSVRKEVLFRVPSCVDLHHFAFSENARVSIRKKYQIPDFASVLVYMGKFGGMYMEEEAFELFRVWQKAGGWVMILSQDLPSKIIGLAEQASLDKSCLIFVSLMREQIPTYLSAAEIGLVATRQCPSKKYSSPIKIGEYLACGLPLIVPTGISDDDTTLAEKGLAILMKTVETETFEEVVFKWQTWVKTRDAEYTRKISREYVESDRSVESYKQLYAELFARI